jgi:hypothetical protein
MGKIHNRLVGPLVAALLLAPCLGTPAWSGPLPDGGVTKEEVAAALKKRGLDSRFTVDKDGDPLIESNFEGLKFSVYFYECEKNPRCKSFQFAAGFTTKAVSAAKVVDWHRLSPFGRTYLDKEGDPWVEMDVDAEHGATTEALENDVGRWQQVMREYRKYIGWK